MVTIITPTGGRHLCFKLLESYVTNQKCSFDYEWLVVDDGVKPVSFTNPSIKHIHVPGMLNLWRKLVATQDFISNETDKILILEDDDYYAPNYLTTMSTLLDAHELVGETRARYYNIALQQWMRMNNTTHASLAQTGFRFTLYEKFITLCKKVKTSFDVNLWGSVEGFLFDDLKDEYTLHCGMKSMPGRVGIGCGHKLHHKYAFDTGFQMLRQWVSDSSIYEELMT